MSASKDGQYLGEWNPFARWGNPSFMMMPSSINRDRYCNLRVDRSELKTLIWIRSVDENRMIHPSWFLKQVDSLATDPSSSAVSLPE